MRYSALQEDSYGASLGQCTSPNDVDKSMMAATGDVEPGGDTPSQEGSMISNLPLLFANGYPTSLEKITLLELERFVTFMVQCSLGPEAAEVIIEPQWWPKEVKFIFPLAKPKKANDMMYMAYLKKLVFRCYTYHRGEYLLRFCAYLAQYPRDKLEYVNNWDSTTSLYLKTTGKLLVTFRNENMNYDKKVEPSRRSLLPMNKTNSPNSTKCLRRRSGQKRSMVEPITDDIYLCDNCDAEFVGLYRMKEHEKLCYRPEPRPITPEVEEVPELKQDQFMEYFMLKSKTAAPKRTNSRLSPYLSDYGDQTRSSGRIRGSVNLTRCPTIPFSSPAGLALAKKSKMMSDVIQQERLDRIERHTYAPALCSVNAKPKWFKKTHDYEKWIVTFKPSKSEEPHCHHYKFGNHTEKPALNLRSQLLYVACKPIYVRMTRQSDEELAHLMQEPSRYKTPEREIPRVMLRRSPSVEALSEPCSDAQPIVIELDDDEPLPDTDPVETIYTAPTPPPPPVRATTTLYRQSLPLLPTTTLPSPSSSTTSSSSGSSVVALGTCRRRISGPRSKTKRTRHSEPPVMFVDLCSSDDDGNDDVVEQQPDSRSGVELLVSRESEPSPTELRVLEQPSFMRASHGMQLTPSKLCAKPCVHPADSTSNWMPPIPRKTVGLFKQAAAYFRSGP